jgi:hypothetical protein
MFGQVLAVGDSGIKDGGGEEATGEGEDEISAEGCASVADGPAATYRLLCHRQHFVRMLEPVVLLRSPHQPAHVRACGGACWWLRVHGGGQLRLCAACSTHACSWGQQRSWERCGKGGEHS